MAGYKRGLLTLSSTTPKQDPGCLGASVRPSPDKHAQHTRWAARPVTSWMAAIIGQRESCDYALRHVVPPLPLAPSRPPSNPGLLLYRSGFCRLAFRSALARTVVPTALSMAENGSRGWIFRRAGSDDGWSPAVPTVLRPPPGNLALSCSRTLEAPSLPLGSVTLGFHISPAYMIPKKSLRSSCFPGLHLVTRKQFNSHPFSRAPFFRDTS